MASTAKTNGPTTETQTQTHSSITKHIKLNIKHHHNLQTQKPIYPKIKQIGQQVKLEEGNGFMGREVLGWERSEIGRG